MPFIRFWKTGVIFSVTCPLFFYYVILRFVTCPLLLLIYATSHTVKSVEASLTQWFTVGIATLSPSGRYRRSQSDGYPL